MGRRHDVEFSRHHTFWPARDYAEPDVFRELRELHVATMRHAGHIALHKSLDPPPRPDLNMAVDYLTQLSIDRPSVGVESLEYAVEYFAYNYIHYMGNPDKSEQMLGIAHHISQQLMYIKNSEDVYGI